MVRYDSSTKSLTLQRKSVVDGEAMTTEPLHIDLSLCREPVRQALIRLVKYAVNYCNGHNEKEDTQLSLINKLIQENLGQVGTDSEESQTK